MWLVFLFVSVLDIFLVFGVWWQPAVLRGRRSRIVVEVLSLCFLEIYVGYEEKLISSLFSP